MAADGRTRLGLTTRAGESVVLDTAHVIAATGFVPELARLELLDAGLRAALETVGRSGAPELSPGFESSWPGLFFAGLLSAPSFGPSMRFVHGAGFTAGRLVRGVRKRLGARGPRPGSPGVARPDRAASPGTFRGTPRASEDVSAVRSAERGVRDELGARAGPRLGTHSSQPWGTARQGQGGGYDRAPYAGPYATASHADQPTIYLSMVKRWREAGRTLPGHPDEEWERLISQPCWPGR